jgi:tetratricopeptide (TPR) repeat protein
LGMIGQIYQNQGAYDKALANFQEVKKVSEEIGDIKSVSISLHNIGIIYQLKGDYEAALTQYRKALKIAEKIGDIQGVALLMGQMGKLYFEQNQFETALKYFLQAFPIFAKIGSPKTEQMKNDIALCREKMPEEQFKAILKENGMMNDE